MSNSFISAENFLSLIFPVKNTLTNPRVYSYRGNWQFWEYTIDFQQVVVWYGEDTRSQGCIFSYVNSNESFHLASNKSHVEGAAAK